MLHNAQNVEDDTQRPKVDLLAITLLLQNLGRWWRVATKKLLNVKEGPVFLIIFVQNLFYEFVHRSMNEIPSTGAPSPLYIYTYYT